MKLFKLQIPFEATFSEMEDLEKLRPFKWLCQLCGFFPYQMEVNPVTKRFKCFTFSIFHPVAFWYFFLIFIHLIPPSIWILKKTQGENVVDSSKYIPVTLLSILVNETIHHF